MIETFIKEISKNIDNINSNLQKELDSLVKKIEPLSDLDVLFEKSELTKEMKEEIRKETGWPDEIIDGISSLEEYEIYKNAGLIVVEINGKPCLVKEDIDMNQVDEKGRTNTERGQQGLPLIDKNGNSLELHHMGQKKDGPLVELTQDEHRGAGNDKILHDKSKESEINRTEFMKERQDHWKSRVE